MNETKLPKDWKIEKVSTVANLIRGINYTKDVASNIPFEDSLPILRGNNINVELNFDGLVYVPKAFIKQEQIIKKDDIIFAMSSGSKHLVGKTAVAKIDFNGSYGAFCALLRINEGINKKYVSYIFKGNTYRKLISEIAKGTSINNLKKEHILDFEFPLPPLETQYQIVSKIEELFSELDKGIEDLKTAQQQLKTYRQSVLKWAFEGKKKLPIGDLFDFVGGGTPSKQNPDYWVGEIPWASVKDIKGEYLNDTIDRISDEGLKNSSANIANKGEVILITRISPGKAIITNIKTAINQDLKVVRPKFKTTSKFIFYVFQAIERECIKKSNGTTVLGINLTSLKEIEVPNLNLKEQDQIVQEIESRLSVADKMEESIAQSLLQAESLRQSILKKAFSGELV